MKKLLVIMVFSFSLIFLNSCGGPTSVNVPGVGDVSIAQNNCRWNDETCIWNWYKSEPHTYKIYGTALRGYGVGAPVYAMAPSSEDRALRIFFNQPTCKVGCKVTHIGINKITKSKEIELAEKYMPPLLFDKIYPNTIKTTVKKKNKKKKKPSKKKEENLTEEQLWDKLIKSFFGDRKLHKIEGVWGYKKKNEKEARIYAIVQSNSDDYLYEEIVWFHPIREFETLQSTKIIKKINDIKYKMKAGYGVGVTNWRDGTITILNDYALKFEAGKHCSSTNENCLPPYEVIKRKIWPEETYSEANQLTDEQIKKISDNIFK